MAKDKPIKIEDFTGQAAVINCLKELRKQFGENGESLVVSDVVDDSKRQYVHLVQKGGGVLGVALVGYTYILEQMNIRFIRLAGTSAGAINTALMTVTGAEEATVNGKRILRGDKAAAKSEDILKEICALDFFSFVDGHPVARWLIKRFISNADFSGKAGRLVKRSLGLLLILPLLCFVSLGLQHQCPPFQIVSKFLFVLTAFYILLAAVAGAYISYLVKRLKNAGFGINPGDTFYDWIKSRLQKHHVHTVSDLMAVAETPPPNLSHRHGETTDDLKGDVTFIASEIVTENKIEFPKMWDFFKKDKDELQPAGFVRASMSIPVFFESYFINDIACDDPVVKKNWESVGETNPPDTARFVDGGILSNFPINLFFNPAVSVPRLPSFGIDLDDAKLPEDVFKNEKGQPNPKNAPGKTSEDETNRPELWSFGGYLYRMFNTVRFYYDKDFLIKNQLYKKGIGTIPLKGFGWLNFFLSNDDKKKMFALGARAACHFLLNFNWEDYKNDGIKLRQQLAAKTK